MAVEVCSAHPSYKGYRKPTADCSTCRAIWEAQEKKRAASPSGKACSASPFDLYEGSEEVLQELRKEGCSEAMCAKALSEQFKEEGFTKSAVHRRLRKLAMSGRIDLGLLKGFIRKQKKGPAGTKQGVNVNDIANQFRVCPAEAIHAIEQLQEGHTLLDIVEDRISLSASVPQSSEPFVIDSRKHTEEIFPIGCIADTHLGSKSERLDALNNFYDRCEAEGVKDVYLAGNMIEGESTHNKFDLNCPAGFEAQVDYFIANFPQRRGMRTLYVTGDDHEGWYIQREHINVGEHINLKAESQGRRDLIYIGHIERDVEFVQEGGSAIFRVIHAGGGSAYAISYTSQKYVEMLQGGEKPKFVLVGHYHKFDWSYPREVYVLQPGSFKDQDTWMRKKKLQSIVGGCIVWLRQNDMGIFTSVKVEFFPYFDKRFYQHKW